MKEDFIKIISILIAAFFIVYLVINMFHIQPIREGLENQQSQSQNINNLTASLSGVAGSAENYAASIKAKTVQIQDTVLISKYRKDYENVIIFLDDYLSALMLEQVLSMNVSDNLQSNIQKIQIINTLSTGKKTLNEVMSYIDKH
jgi:hypothetical protein